MTAYTQRHAQVTRTQVESFGVTDRLNRLMGIRIAYETLTYTLKPEGSQSGWPVEPGVYYSYETQTTRNGNAHQASHGGKRFATEAERDAAAAKALKAAKARAEKPEARLKA